MQLRKYHHQVKSVPSKYLIIDTDAGADDAQALVVAFHLAKKYNKTLLGITTINGNTSVDNVVTNVLITQAICGTKYPVFKGATQPMVGKDKKDFYFSEDGLGTKQQFYLEKLGNQVDFSLVSDTPAYKFIAECALSYQGQLAILALGPLTNLALAYHYENSMVNYLTQISVMGGSDTLCGFNQAYTAEFNLGFDPEATFIVFKTFPKIKMISFDTSILSIDPKTYKELFLEEEHMKGKYISCIYELIKGRQDPPLCDPLSVVAFFRPDCIKEGINVRIIIQLMGKRTRGATVIDWFSEKKDEHNTYIIKEFNMDLMISEIKESYI